MQTGDPHKKSSPGTNVLLFKLSRNTLAQNFKENKKGWKMFPDFSFYGRFLSVITITAPTAKTTSMIAIDIGMK